MDGASTHRSKRRKRVRRVRCPDAVGLELQ